MAARRRRRAALARGGDGDRGARTTAKTANVAYASLLTGTATVDGASADAAAYGDSSSGLVFEAEPSGAPAKPRPTTVLKVSGAITIQPGSKKATLQFSDAGLTKSVKFNVTLAHNGKSKTVKFTLKRPKT